MPFFKAVFWDNDGVLVDTEQLYYRANVDTLADMGHGLSEDDYIRLFLAADTGTVGIMKQLGYPTSEVEPYRRRRDERYSEILLEQSDLAIAGVHETVAALHGHVAMGIVTSSRKCHFDLIHANTELTHRMEFILTNADYSKAKPDPEPYLKAIELSGLAPRDCVVIEDSERGLTSAKAAGLACWIVPSRWSARMEFSAADRILESVRDVGNLLF